MSEAVHPTYARVRADVTAALDAGRLTPSSLAMALAELGQGGAAAVPADLLDAVRRLAWLLFRRVRTLDGRWVALTPMYLAQLAGGQLGASALLDELEAVERAAGADRAPLDALLTTHGDALQGLLGDDLAGGGAGDRIDQLHAAFRAQVRDAALGGRWGEVPLPGPDAPTARGCLAALPPDVALAVLEAWLDAEQAVEGDDLEAARARLDDAAVAAPGVFETFVRRARVLFAGGDRLRAGADLERALSLHPGSAAARSMRAELRAVIRDMQGSLADWDEAIRLAPDQVAFRIGRGYTWVALGDLGKALADFDEAVRLAPDDTTPLYNRADVHVRRGDLDAAARDYDRVLELDADDPQARMNRGTVHLMRRRGDEAAADFGAVVEQHPKQAMAWAKRAAACMTAQRPWETWLDGLTALALAEPDWQHAEQITGLVRTAYLQLPPGAARPDDVAARAGLLTERVGGAEAVRFADLLAEHMPGEHLTYHLVRGRAYVTFGKWDRAAEAFRDALAVDPAAPEARVGLGTAEVHVGRADEALAHLDAALAAGLEPAQAFDAHHARARALAMRRDLPGAVDAFRDALRARPDAADVWFYLGVHLDLLGDRQAAVAAYDQSLGLDETFAPAWFNRGCEHAALGDKDQALADLERAAALEPRWAAEARTDPYWQGLWADPDFTAMVARFGA